MPGDLREVAWLTTFAWTVDRLRRRGIDPTTAEDSAQEAATRAISRGVEFADDSHRRAWMATVAHNIAIGKHRHTARIDGPPSDDIADTQDVAAIVEARLTLDATLNALPKLSAREREALLSRRVGETRRERQRIATARHRARVRLLAMVEGVGVAVAIRYERIRRVLDMSIEPTVAASLAVVAVSALPFAHRLPTEPHPPAPPAAVDYVDLAAANAAIPNARPEPAPPANPAPTVPAPARRTPAGNVDDLRVRPVDGVDIAGRRGSRDEPIVCVDFPGQGPCAYVVDLPRDTKHAVRDALSPIPHP